ncbi:MAG TPA: hypothetical protein VNM39_13210 [Verrucomicrobiae bacterium]|nr:hypothetical protein [Verrucomicrobiae bacterium]
MTKAPRHIIDESRFVDPPRREVRALLPFDWTGWCFIAKTAVPFRPTGLALWGASLAQAYVSMIRIGNTIEGITAIGRLPAQFFALRSGEGYQQLHDRIERGEEPHGWAEFSTVIPGVLVQIEVERDGKPIGPADGVELAMWGESFR